MLLGESPLNSVMKIFNKLTSKLRNHSYNKFWKYVTKILLVKMYYYNAEFLNKISFEIGVEC